MKEMKKCRDRKSLMPCDSTKSSLLAATLLICLNLSYCNVALTCERRIGCNCCLWGAAGSSQHPHMRAVFTGAGGHWSQSCLDLVLVTLSKKLTRDEFWAMSDDADRPALIPHLPASACPQFWLKVVVPAERDETALCVLVSSIGHHLSSWGMSARWPLQLNGHQASARLNARLVMNVMHTTPHNLCVFVCVCHHYSVDEGLPSSSLCGTAKRKVWKMEWHPRGKQ